MKVIYTWNSTKEILEIPSDFNKERQNIRYGKLEELNYHENKYSAQVLLPPDYDNHRLYPTLYLLNGAGCNEEWMKNHVDIIIGNLKKNVNDVIVVMPRVLTDERSDYSKKISDYYAMKYYFQELVSSVECKYNVYKDREYRAIAGNSMGGMCALFLGCIFQDMIATIAAISPSVLLFDMLNGKGKEEKFNLKPSNSFNFYFATGDNDALIANAGGAIKYRRILLNDNKIESAFIDIPGEGHNWNAFGPLFYAFMFKFISVH